MKITKDKQARMMYVCLRDFKNGEKVSYSKNFDNYVIDFDDNNEPMGVEVFGLQDVEIVEYE